MPIQFPIVPQVPGVPQLASFPGVGQITGSISGNVLTVTQGLSAVSPGIALNGVGVAAGTVISGGLQSIVGGVGTAMVSIQQSVANVSMMATGVIDLNSLGIPTDLLAGPLSSDAFGLGAEDGGVGSNSWGVFLNGSPVIVPDSVLGVDFKADWHIADYPLEGGDFETYNKVRLPYDARVTMVKEGTVADRTGFLESAKAAAQSLDLYTVVTPDAVYESANIVHYDYSRKTSNGGASMVVVTIWLQEVRVAAVETFATVASPSAADQQVSGAVQTTPSTATQQKQFQGHGATGSW